MPALTRTPGRHRRPRRFVRLVRRYLRRDDRGAVAVMFAILLAGGVLLGMLGLVVDVGRLYTEREELQTSADAAALAVAKACAADPSSCVITERQEVAAKYADANASDGTSAFSICGVLPGVPGLDPCTPPADNLTRCIGDVPAGAPYLEVRTSTRLPDGSSLLPPSFAQAMLGNEGYDGTQVGACARVAWGAPKAGLAVTFSKCEYDMATKNGFPDPPPYPPNTVPDFGYEIVLKTHDANGNPACPAGPAGWDRPGGFGWLDETGTNQCVTETYTAGATGVTEKDCTDILDPATDSAAVAKVFYIPIYDDVHGTGNAAYHIYKMAAFVPTGYFLGQGKGQNKKSWLTGRDYAGDPYNCTGQARCIFGYFVDVVHSGIPIGSLTPLGANVVTLVG